MKTTLELPEELVKEIKLRAVHEGKKLKEAIAQLLRRGLDATAGVDGTAVTANEDMLARRKSLTQKFVAGEWGVELAGFEEARLAERRLAAQRAAAWSK